MNFFLNYVVPNKKLIIEKEKSKNKVYDKELTNVLEEQVNFPKEFPKPISLSELTKYYGIIWKRNCSQKSSQEKKSNKI